MNEQAQIRPVHDHALYSCIMLSVRLFLCLISLIGCFAGVFNADASPGQGAKRVLLLNSYHKGFVWTDEITRGVEETLSRKRVDLHVEYMDTKRQFDAGYQALLNQLLSYKHDRHQYDVVISSDNNAFNFFREQGETIFGKVPFVFCGVNYLQKEDLHGLTQVTGVDERADIVGNLALIKQVHPDCRKIVVISDNTTTGKVIQKEVGRLNKKRDTPDPELRLLFDVSAKELIDAVRNFEPHTIALFTFFFRDNRGVFFEYDKGTEMVCDNASVPVYGTWNFQLNHGIVGGNLVGGYDQGAYAAEKTLAILAGRPVGEIPVSYETPTRLCFDFRQLRRHAISPERLPSDSTIFNQPVSFYTENRRLILNTLIAFFLLLLAFIGVTYGLVSYRNLAGRLRESDNRFRAAFDSAQDCLLIWDKDYNCLYANQAGIDHLGFNRDKLIAEKIIDGPEHVPDYIRLWKKRIDSVINTGKRLRVQDHQEIRGRFYHTDSILSPIRNIDGKVVSVCVLYRDVTELKKVEEELRHLRNYLSNIINSMPSVLVGVDRQGIVTQWNNTAEQVTGITADRAQGRRLPEVFPQMANEMEKIRESMRSCKPQQEQTRSRLADNNIFYEDLTIYPLVANGVEGAVIRVDDVTEKVRMEDMMIQSEKMLSVGGLAAGMAHEINNPLAGMMQTSMVMYNRLIDVDMRANRRIAEENGITMEAIQKFMEARGIFRMISSINESGRRAAAIVDNMLSFARKKESGGDVCDIADLMDKTLALATIDYDLKKNYNFKTIKIVKEYQKNLPPVFCESSEIQQVFLNILRNGAHAMQDSGTQEPVLIVRVGLEAETESLCVEIEDNGPGMDDGVRKRVFEPFFTTKPVGVGTGLGLSVSYFIIVENHGGEIAVESAPGVGAKFIISLPIKRKKIDI